MLRRLALAAIRAYQHHLSPRKGFCCAYRYYTGKASCSALGYRVIRRHGALRGLLLLRRRLGRCGEEFRRHRSPLMRSAQAGFCDCSCDIDPGQACDIASSLPGDCNWNSRRKDGGQGTAT